MSASFAFRRVRRLALAGLAALALSSCVVGEGDDRHLQPIPAALQSLMSGKGMTQADPILVRIFKKESELEVWKRDRSGRYALLKTYPMCRWSGQLGPKTREGDRQAPEGFYSVTADLMNPRSQFHLSYNLGYPNPLERSQGFTGSALMVHGACTSAGCYAMTDDGVGELYALAREAFSGGQRDFQVQAFPFRMTARNMAAYRASPHIGFWRNLKEGYDHFEATRRPPRIAYCGRRYVFDPADGSGPFVAGAPCPAYEVEAASRDLVAALRSREEARIGELVAAGTPALSYTYRDGGMHESFRRLLRQVGPERMQQLVSAKVAISNPEAALADPYAAGASDTAQYTGSLGAAQ
jgi:murein L,D-transpeptidase YafK